MGFEKRTNIALVAIVGWLAVLTVPHLRLPVIDIGKWIPIVVASDAPIKVPGFHCLLVDETSERQKLSEDQKAVFSAKEVLDYLRAKSGPNGWRHFDPHTNAANDLPVWQGALKLANESERKSDPNDSHRPWILVSNGTSGFNGPLPANVADMMALLRKYGD